MDSIKISSSSSFVENWTDTEWKKFREWLVDMMKITPMTVTFTKTDGSERVMKCSLQESVLPKKVLTEDKPTRKSPSEDIVVVYDIEKSEYRSFNIRSVKRVEGELV